MKKIAISIIACIVPIIGYGQIELKGITLGKVYDADPVINTSLGGEEGIISGDRLDDGRVYQIEFKLPDPGDIISEDDEKV